ncbi:MAG: hypothetical protein ACE5HD_00710 [Acidobacteriota bacterium]
MKDGSIRAVAGPALLVLLLVACEEQPAEIRSVVDEYIRAVQERDHDRLADLSGPLALRLEAAPAGEREAIRADYLRLLDRRQAAYLQDRETGRLSFHADGVVLVRALNLGRGVYYQTVEERFPEPGRAVLIQEVRLAYRFIDLSRLPPGTTIYLLGMPLGRIYRPVIGGDRPAARRLLDTVWIRWNLVKVDGRWRVESVGWDADRPPVHYADTTRY